MVNLWPLLLLAGCATAESPPAEIVLDGQMLIRPLCYDGQFVGLLLGATGPGVHRVEFDPREVCGGRDLDGEDVARRGAKPAIYAPEARS